MNRPTSNNEEENRLPASSGEATFLSDIQAAGTVNNGETVVNPAIIKPASPKSDPSKTVLPSSSSDPSSSFTFDASAPADSQSPNTPQAPIASTSTDAAADKSSIGTAPTLVGQLQINAQQAPFPGHRSDDQKAQDPKTEKTFLSSQNIDPVGATIIGAPVPQDGEDFFDTLKDSDVDPKSSLRGYVVGDYQILSELGRGGMGVVYKAKHRKLNRVVALKMILAGKHSGNEALGRFIAEAQAVAKLQHPGIVQIFDIGEHEGLPYFSLEYVEGNDLHKDLKGLPRDPKRSAEMVEQLSLAMQYAHDHKLLHRDLKPANILLTRDGQPKISDFGLAKNVDAESSGATNDGTIMGSPSYMPPEQARGENSSMTPRSDLYSLGAILYQMLTARPPFVAERPLDTVLQVINNEPVAPRDLQPGVPVDLETICMKAMQKDPISRYASCAELAADLRRFINDEPILARPVSRLERLVRWCKRNPRVAIPSGLASLFIFITAVVSTWAWSTTSAQAAIIADERDKVKEERDIAQKERDEADRQRTIANQQKAIAEESEEIAKKQATLALENIQFVVTEIDNRLAQQPGSSDLRIAILETVTKEFDKLNQGLTGGIKGEAPATLMSLRFKIANIFLQLDKLPLAKAEMEKLYEQSQDRLAIKGRTDSARLNRAKIAIVLAEIRERSDGDTVASKTLLKEAADLMREVHTNPSPQQDSPKTDEINETLAAALQNLGRLYLKEGKVPEAAAVFEESLKVHASVLDAIRTAPSFAEMNANQKDGATAMKQIQHDKVAMGLAYTQLRLGKTDESISNYEKAIAARREIYDRRTTMLPLKVELSMSLGLYGLSLLWIDRLDAAEPKLTESLTLAEEILAADPEKADFKRNVAGAAYLLGTLRDAQNRPEEALSLFEKSRIRREELFKISDDEKNKINLMLSEARVGNVDVAKKLSDELGTTEKKGGDLHLERARALAQLTRQTEGDIQATMKEAALQALERAVSDGYRDPFRINAEQDLDPLHETDRFKAIVTNLQQAQ